MHKLTHLSVRICPKYIFFFPVVTFSLIFSSLSYNHRETNSCRLGSFLQAGFDTEAFPELDICLCFSVFREIREALGDRKGRCPVGEAQASKTGNIQTLPISLSWKKGTTGVIPKLVQEQGWKDWAVTLSPPCQMMHIGGTNWRVMSYLETHLAHN